MTLKLKSLKLQKSINIPTSKSYANRYLILAALDKSAVTIKDLPNSDDVIHLVSCLEKIGLHISKNGQDVTIHNSFPDCEKEEELILQVGEGGTTARFLAVMLGLGKAQYHLKLAGKLSQRPWEWLLELYQENGASASLEGETLKVQGQLKNWPNSVSALKTTQFATALKMVKFSLGEVLEVIDMETSVKYFEMTQKCCEDLKNQKTIIVPKDWSGASYPLTLAAFQDDPTDFPGLYPDKFQGDELISELLKQRGALVFKNSGMEVSRLKENFPFQVDAKNCLDLVPTLYFLGSFLDGTSEITGVENLIYKESNRIEALIDLSEQLGLKNISYQDKKILIKGNQKLSKVSNLTPVNDHRIVMVAAMFLWLSGGGFVENEHCTNKSYPDFFKINQT